MDFLLYDLRGKRTKSVVVFEGEVGKHAQASPLPSIVALSSSARPLCRRLTLAWVLSSSLFPPNRLEALLVAPRSIREQYGATRSSTATYIARRHVVYLPWHPPRPQRGESARELRLSGNWIAFDAPRIASSE